MTAPKTKVIVVDGDTLNIPADVTQEEETAIVQQHLVAKPPKPVAGTTTQPPGGAVPGQPPALLVQDGPGVGDKTVDWLKQGFAEGLGVLGGAVNALGDGALAGVRSGVNLVAIAEGMKTGFKRTMDASQTFGQEFMGVKDIQPDSQIGRIAQAGVKAIADPLSLVTGGASVARAAGTSVASATRALTKDVAVSASSGAGGQSGADLVASQGGNTATQVVGAILGGVIAPTASRRAVGATVRLTGADKAAKAVAEFGYNNLPRTRAAAQEMQAKAAAAASAQIDAIAGRQLNQMVGEAAQAYQMRTGQSLADRLEQSIGTQRELGIESPTLQGVASPELDAMRTQALNTPGSAASRGTFAATSEDIKDRARAVLEQNLGDAQAQSYAVGEVLLEPKAVRMQKEADDVLKKLQEKRDNQMETFLGSPKSDIALGEEIRNTVEATRKQAQASFEPRYEALMEDFVGHGVPAQYLKQEVIPKLEALTSSKFFDTFPRIRQATRRLEKFADTGGLPVEELKGLKEEVNLAIRDARKSPSGAPDLRILNDIKDTIFGSKNLAGVRSGGMADAVSPEFSQRLRAVDADYRSSVGEVFDIATLRDLTRSEYDARVVKTLTAMPEVAIDLVKATKGQAVPLVEDALLQSLRKTADTRKLTDVDLQRWVTKNAEVLEYLPDLKGRVKTVEDTRAAMAAAEDTLKRQLEKTMFSRFAENVRQPDGVLTTSVDVLSAAPQGRAVPRFTEESTLVGRVVRDPQFMRNFLEQYKGQEFGDAVNAVQAMAVREVLKSDRPLQSLLQISKDNPTLAAVLIDYQKKVGKLLTLLDEMAPSQVPITPGSLKGPDALQRAVGISAENLTDVLRSKLASVFNKAGTIAKIVTKNRAQDRMNQDLLQLVDSPERLVQTIRQLEAVQKGGDASMEAAKTLAARSMSGVRAQATEAFTGLTQGIPAEVLRRAYYQGTQTQYTDTEGQRRDMFNKANQFVEDANAQQ